MGELTNALQGKLNAQKGHIKNSSGRQMDLFSSLSDRPVSAPKIVMSKPEIPAVERPEPEMILPPSSLPSPDVMADVRSVLSESGPARPVETSSQEGEPPLLRTGVYHRPQRPAPPPPVAAPRSPSAPRPSLVTRIRGWFAGVEMDRRMLSLVVVLCVLVALIGFWSACPRGEKAAAETASISGETPEPEETAPAAPPPAAPSVPVSPAPAASAPASADWKIPGAETTMSGGAYLIRFSDPVFVSADKISVEGWSALKTVAAKLATLRVGTRVVVTGFTDDVPLSKPTEQFKSNADIAAARAKVATEHLAQFAKANKGLVFEARTGEPSQAPFPNDTPQNRRLNRTATVQVIPAP